MLKIVLDTNLLVSAVISSQGNPARILGLFRKNLIEIVISEEMIVEIQKVLNYPKIRKRHVWNTEEIESFVRGIKEICIVVTPKFHSGSIVTQDPSDDKFLHCAVAGEVDYIVTGDNHLLRLGKYSGIQIVTPGQFLEIYTNLERL